MLDARLVANSLMILSLFSRQIGYQSSNSSVLYSLPPAIHWNLPAHIRTYLLVELVLFMNIVCTHDIAQLHLIAGALATKKKNIQPAEHKQMSFGE